MRRSSADLYKKIANRLSGASGRATLAIASLVILSVVAGCGNKDADSSASNTPQTPASTTPAGPDPASVTPGNKDIDGPIKPGDPITPGREPAAGS